MNYFYLFLIAVDVLVKVYADEDYYKLLGIPRTATSDQIRKAFRKLAIRHHPDKNKDDPEQARKIFAKIANAYDVLNDPEKRKIYDEQGEEGIKKPQQDWGNQNFDGMFSQFFGRHFEFNFGEGGGHHHNFGFNHDEFHRRKNAFEGSEVINLGMETISKFYRRQEVWFIYFYKIQEQQHLEIAEHIKKLCEKAQGIFQVGVINCNDQEELCEDFGQYGTPKVLLFTQNSNEEPISYNKDYNEDEMFKLAVSKLHNFVEVVTDETHEEFMNRYPQQIKVIYFSDSEGTPPLLKILSTESRGYLHFGLVRKTEQKILETYKIQQFPTLMVVYDTEGEGHKYTEEFKRID